MLPSGATGIPVQASAPTTPLQSQHADDLELPAVRRRHLMRQDAIIASPLAARSRPIKAEDNATPRHEGAVVPATPVSVAAAPASTRPEGAVVPATPVSVAAPTGSQPVVPPATPGSVAACLLGSEPLAPPVLVSAPMGSGGQGRADELRGADGVVFGESWGAMDSDAAKSELASADTLVRDREYSNVKPAMESKKNPPPVEITDRWFTTVKHKSNSKKGELFT